MGHVDALSRCHTPSASERGEADGKRLKQVIAHSDSPCISAVSDEPMTSDSRLNMEDVSNSMDCSVISMVDSENVDFQIRAAKARDPALLALKRNLEGKPSTPSALYELTDGVVCRREYSCRTFRSFNAEVKIYSLRNKQ